MTFEEIANKRYSCRKYKAEMPDKKLIEKILDVARIAPSAVNFQPWHFIVVNDPVVKAKLDESYSRDWFKTAPAAIIVCGDHSKAWHRKDGKDHTDIDAAIAADHITLQASELGLATCWVCNFNKDLCNDLFKLPDNIEPVVILPLGYPEDEPNKLHYNRKELSEVIHWNNFEINENN